ncbi:cubilin-like [Saccostrea cucullata]|uniref:cubilin-like n=1 Tax=Saccostrea cuccullata TaxID=36930 RepID=UPI002ED32965
MLNITGIRGSLTSPGFPGNYPNNVNYTWILNTGHVNATAVFLFDFMNIFQHRFTFSCTDDFVKGTEIDPCCFDAMTICGEYGPFSLTVRGRLIRINFVSDEWYTAKGFSLAWIVSRPEVIKISTHATKSITKTQKSTPRTTKLPYRTTLTSRKTTKDTIGTTESITRTTRMQRKSTMKNTAKNPLCNLYDTKQGNHILKRNLGCLHLIHL